MTNTLPGELIENLRNTYGRVAYTHKCHEKQAEIFRSWTTRIKIANAAVFSVAAITAVLAPLLSKVEASWVAAVASAVGLAFAFFQLSFDPASDAYSHTVSAKSYLEIRNELRHLLADARSQVLTLSAFLERRDALDRRLSLLDGVAPATSNDAYRRARGALQGSESINFGEDELKGLEA